MKCIVRIFVISLVSILIVGSMIPVFSQVGSRNIMEEYCQVNWKNDPVGCKEYINEGKFVKPENPSNQFIKESSDSQITSSKKSDIIKFSDDSILFFIIVGLVIIGGIGVGTYKIISKRDSKQPKIKSEPKQSIEKQETQKEEQLKIDEKERWNKFQEEEKKRKEEYAKFEREREMQLKIEKEERERIDEKRRLENKKEKEEREKRQEEKRLEEIKKEQELEEKIKNHENLYDPKMIGLLDDSASIRIFYDLEKKDAKYWNETDLIDRIHIKDKEIRDEIKIKQNKITFKISVERGGQYKFAKLISGGNMEFWDHDTAGYYLQIHLSKIEEFLKIIMIKHIRHSFPSIQIHVSTHSITAILIREDADYHDASNVLKRIVKSICDELIETGDVLIEK